MSDGPVRASGVVLVRGTLERGPELLLIHRPRYDDWSLPKGKDDPGETPEAAALRELQEETGYHATLLEPLDDQHYTVSGRPKVVKYFLGRPIRDGGFQPNSEVDQIRWLPVNKARKKLTYAHDRTLIDDPRVRRETQTGKVYLLRHAQAGERSAWDGDDMLRPLTKKGTRQAERIADLLSAQGLDAIHSSPYIRCMDTVRPLASRSGLEVADSPSLAEGADTDETLDLINDASGVRIVLCSHGDLIPDVLQRLDRRGTEIHTPNGKVKYSKASIWEITVEEGTPVRAEYHAPP